MQSLANNLWIAEFLLWEWRWCLKWSSGPSRYLLLKCRWCAEMGVISQCSHMISYGFYGLSCIFLYRLFSHFFRVCIYVCVCLPVFLLYTSVKYVRFIASFFFNSGCISQSFCCIFSYHNDVLFLESVYHFTRYSHYLLETATHPSLSSHSCSCP